MKVSGPSTILSFTVFGPGFRDVVKDKILSICNVNLSDNGIAYVSYNTYPGWKRLEQLRDIMLYSENGQRPGFIRTYLIY